MISILVMGSSKSFFWKYARVYIHTRTSVCVSASVRVYICVHAWVCMCICTRVYAWMQHRSCLNYCLILVAALSLSSRINRWLIVLFGDVRNYTYGSHITTKAFPNLCMNMFACLSAYSILSCQPQNIRQENLVDIMRNIHRHEIFALLVVYHDIA